MSTRSVTGRRMKRIAVVVFSLWLFLGWNHDARAVMIDSDLDGVTDWGEGTLYHTDPEKADTDGDGVSDGEELLEETDPLNPDVSKLGTWETTSGEPALARIDSESLAWYVGRAAGILSFVLLTFVVINGLLISSRIGMRFIPPPVNLDMHRFASWILILMVLLHGLSFMFDRYIHLSWFELLVPFQAQRSFLSALGFDMNLVIAPGIIGLYVITLLILTSEFRKMIPTKAWRAIHYTSFLGYIILVFHGVAAGTDSVFNWTKILYIGSGTVVVILTILRIRSAILLRRKIAEAKSLSR